ncbi:hypothetical protein VaNZ11_013579, partial [Volvox africanus]
LEYVVVQWLVSFSKAESQVRLTSFLNSECSKGLRCALHSTSHSYWKTTNPCKYHALLRVYIPILAIQPSCTPAAHHSLRACTPYTAGFPGDIPEPELLINIYDLYRTRFQVVPRDHGAHLRHLLVLQAFAEEWQVRELRLPLPQPRSCRALSQLHLVGSHLRHLELLEAAWMTDLTFLQVPPPQQSGAELPTPPAMRTLQLDLTGNCVTTAKFVEPSMGSQNVPVLQLQPHAEPLRLTCLALRGCRELNPAALGPGLLGMAPWLQVLDLSGAERLDDSCAAVLAALKKLQVLNLNYTAVGDATLAALTYGSRVWAWSRSHGVPPPPEAAAWPELSIQHWHLAGTRVTGSGLALLAETSRLVFLDVRGSGVPRAALRPLESRFQLTLVQGAVLARSNALAAALVNHPQHLACACSPADMAALGPISSTPSASRTSRRRQMLRRRRQHNLPGATPVEKVRYGEKVLRRADEVPPGGEVTGMGPTASGTGQGDGGGEEMSPATSAVSQHPVWGSREEGVEVQGIMLAADRQQQWMTRGIRDMIDESEQLLRLEAQHGHHGWG